MVKTESGGDEAPEIVLVMLSSFGPGDGGRETWAYQFVPRLLLRYPDFRLRIVGMRLDNEIDYESTLRSHLPTTEQHRITVQILSCSRSRVPNALQFVWKLRRAFRAPQPQVKLVLAVGSFVELAAVLASRAFKKAGKIVWLRSVFTSEKAGRYPKSLRPLIERLERAILSRADNIVANGEDTAQAYRRSGLSVEVIPNATELKRWDIPPPKFEAPISVAFIGRLTAVKGIAEFLEAAKLLSLKDHASKFRFHVIGDGPEQAAVLAAEAAGLLEYHGRVPNENMPEVLTGIDVCVALTFGSSSNRNGTPGGAGTSNAAIEQMAAGRLLVCWANAPFRQLADETSALFVREGGAAELAQALVGIADDPESARRVAHLGKMQSLLFGFDRHLELFDLLAKRWLRRPSDPQEANT